MAPLQVNPINSQQKLLEHKKEIPLQQNEYYSYIMTYQDYSGKMKSHLIVNKKISRIFQMADNYIRYLSKKGIVKSMSYNLQQSTNRIVSKPKASVHYYQASSPA